MGKEKNIVVIGDGGAMSLSAEAATKMLNHANNTASGGVTKQAISVGNNQPRVH